MEQRRAVAATLSLFRDIEAQEGSSIIRQGDVGAVARGSMGAPLARVSLLRNMGAGRGRQRKAGTVLRDMVAQY